ncbi:MAG: hypothetical protein K6F58_04315 [Bacteroidales bacterium]|nr:hypothetical protein [Bacteroidales bacterium]
MKKQMPYSIPEGYMQDMQRRLEEIPVSAKGPSSWQKITPYLALAAVFAAAFVLGGTLLRSTASRASSGEDMVAYFMDSDLTVAQLEDVYFYSED